MTHPPLRPVILYNPVNCPGGGKPALPMSLLALGALLEGRVPYEIIDGNLVDDGYATLVERIESTGAGLLAITVMPGPQLRDAIPICQRLKSRWPELVIVWGGYFPTLHPDTVIKADYVDFAFQGHCEHAFVSLVESIDRGDANLEEPGLVSFDRPSGQIRKNPMGPIPSPDDLPDFPYDRISMERYIRPTFMGSRTASHHSSYGCPFTCNFCGVVNLVGGRYLAQSAERTAAVTHMLVERYDANAVEFFDSNFFVQESRVAEFSERIEPLHIGWWGEGRIDTMLRFSDRTWRLMRDSGLRMVFMGAETASDETLAQMNKGGTQTPDDVLRLAERMASLDIVPELSFVLGCPPDPDKDIDLTLQFIRRVKSVNPDAEIILYLYSPVPLAGDLYSEVQAQGFQFPETLDEWTRTDWEEFAQHRTAELPWLSESHRNKLRNFQRVLHAAYPTVTDRSVTPLRRRLLKTLSGWRYRREFYRFPIELRIMNRLMPYRRPEISGF